MASRRVSSDSSSIILLQKAGLLDIFLKQYQVIVAEAVYDELTMTNKQGSGQLQKLLAGRVRKGDNQIIEGLGRGESAAIELYRKNGADFVLLDDKKGATYCLSRQIPFTNSLLLCRILHRVGALQEEQYDIALEKLIKQGYYSEKIVRKAAALGDDALERFMPR